MTNDDNKKLDEVVDELNKKVDEFAVVALENKKQSDEKTKRSMDDIANGTIEALKALIDQLVVKYDEITDSEKFKEFSETVKALSNSLITEAKKKMNEMQNNPEFRENWEKTKSSAINTSNKVVDSIKDNEDLKETINVVKGVTLTIAKKSADMIKNAYEDISSNPKVKEGIVKAKAATLDAAGKAYDKLEDWLSADEKKIEEKGSDKDA